MNAVSDFIDFVLNRVCPARWISTRIDVRSAPRAVPENKKQNPDTVRVWGGNVRRRKPVTAMHKKALGT
jgi:hypothetical protein